jgi:hypothetical protein
MLGVFGVVGCGLVVIVGVVAPGMLVVVVPVVVPVLAPLPGGVVAAPPLAWLKAGGNRKTAAAKIVIALP